MHDVLPRPISEPVRIAREAFQKKGFGGSKNILIDLIAQHPEEEDLHSMLALTLQWCGEPEAAQRLVDERLEANPTGGMYGVASEVAHIAGDLTAASKLLRQGQDLDPDHFLVLRQQSNMLQTEGDPDGAVEVHHRALSLYPEDPDVYASMMVSYHILGQTEKQQRMLDSAPAWFRGTAQDHNRRGMLALQHHNLVEAESEWRLAVAECPEGGSYWGHLAMALRQLANYDEAERAAQFAIELNPRNAMALRQMAAIAKHRGDLKMAQEFEKKADEAIPAMKHMNMLHRATALSNAGKPLEAVKLLRQMVKVAPPAQIRIPNLLISKFLADAGKWGEVEESLRANEITYPDEPALQLVRFRLLSHQGKRTEAQALLESILESEKRLPEVFPLAIEFFLEQRITDRAMVLVEMVKRDLPGPPHIAASTIMALDKHGHKDIARALHECAYRRYPENDALRLIAMGMTAESGDLSSALRQMSTLPPHLRPRLRVSQIVWTMQFWKVLFRAIFRRKRPRS